MLNTLLRLPRREALTLLALCLIPATAVLASARVGAGMQGDSFGYIAASESVVATSSTTPIWRLFIDAAPGYVHWPLGYPMWLSLHAVFNLPVGAWSVASNAFLSALLVLVTYLLASVAGLGSRWRLLSAALVSVSPAMVEIGWRVQSEALFSLLFVLAVTLLAQAINSRSISWPQIVSVSVLVSCAYLVRYMGAFLIPIVGIAALWLVFKSPQRDRWVKSAALLVGSLVGVLLQGLRNLQQDAEFLGSDRYVQRFSPVEVIDQALPWIGSHLVPLRSAWLSTLVTLAVLSILVTAVVIAIRRRNAVLVFLSITWAFFWSALLLSIYFQDTSPVDWRFIHPVLPVFAVLFISGTAFFFDWASVDVYGRPPVHGRKVRLAIRGAVAFGLIGLLLLSSLRLTLQIRDPVGSGATTTIPVLQNHGS